MLEVKAFKVSSLSSAAEQRKLAKEEEEEVESGEASQRDAPMNMTVGDNVNALRT